MASLWISSFYASGLYKVYIDAPAHGVSNLIAYQTADFSITTSANWTASSDQLDVTNSKWAKYASVATGKTALINMFTYQAYQGTEPMDITFQFAFLGVTDAKSEVVDKCTTLGKIPLSPTASGILVEAPAYEGKWCSVWTNYMKITEWLVPTSTTITYSSTLSKAGYPVKADVSMSFRTKKAVTAPDFTGWFS